MIWLVLGMMLALLLAATIVGIVAIPARRRGRFVLTERGEHVFRVADERARAARTLASRRAAAKESAERKEAEKAADADAGGRWARMAARRTRRESKQTGEDA